MYVDNDDFLAGMFSETTPAAVLPNESHENEIELETTEEETPPVKEEKTPASTANDAVTKYIEFAQANNLLEIPEDIEFDGSVEQLEAIQDYTRKARELRAVEGIFEALPPQFKPLFDYALRGGDSIEEYYKTFVQDPLDQFDTESVSDQKRIIREHYKQYTKFSDEQIERHIALLSNENELKVQAEQAYEELQVAKQERQRKFLEETEQKARLEKEAHEQRALELSKAIDNTNLVHPQRKNKIKTFFFEPMNVQGEVTTGFNNTIKAILSNPEHQAQLADILLEYDPSLGFSQDRLEKRVKTKASQNFQKLVEKVLENKQGKAPSTPPAAPSGQFDWAAFNEQQL